MAKAPTLIDGIPIEEILVPRPVFYDYEGKNIPVTPMTEAQLIAVGDALDGVLQAGQALGGLAALAGMGGVSAAGFLEKALAQLPALVRHALPQVTKVLAGSLNVSEEVAAAIPMYHKVGLLEAIIIAEKLETLAKNASGLGRRLRAFPALTHPEGTAAATD